MPLATLGVVIVMAGCRGTIGPADGAVAQAARIDALESQVAALEVRLAEAEADRDAARAVVRASGREVPSSLPVPLQVVEASGSAVRPAGDDAGADLLQWRLRPEDARSRFIQATGPAVVAAAALDDDGDSLELGRWVIDAAAWRESLREGLLGTSYALDLELERPLPAEAQYLLVRLDLDDVRLDAPLRLESSVPVIRPLDPEPRR